MAEQLNVRIPKSTENQLDELREWTGMTQTQLVIQAIDRLYQELTKEKAALEYESILSNLRQHYADLENRAREGSKEQHTYRQILSFMDQGSNASAPKQRAFETQISLMSLAQVLDPPEMRLVVREAVDALTRQADLPKMSY